MKDLKAFDALKAAAGKLNARRSVSRVLSLEFRLCSSDSTVPYLQLGLRTSVALEKKSKTNKLKELNH